MNSLSLVSSCRSLLRTSVLSLIAMTALCGQLHGQSDLQITSLMVQTTQRYPNTSGAGYTVVQFGDAASPEYRCYLHGHHFLSLTNAGGALALRPHPGVDVNGWGVTLYPQPFIAGAVLAGSAINNVLATSSNILIQTSGLVSRSTSGSHGTWTNQLMFTYSPTTKSIQGTGTYSIRLSGLLSGAGGDLNLVKIANNLLTNVPLLSGSNGITGDMRDAAIGRSANTTNFIWDPVTSTNHFPTDQSDYLSIETSGAYNEVDTEAQGLNPIQAAYKPSLKLVLISQSPGANMQFGGIFTFDLTQDFKADNIGITPIVITNSSRTNFDFDVTISSSALPQDGVGVDAALMASYSGTGTNLAVRYANGVNQPFKQLVGFAPKTGANTYSGTVRVPYPPSGVPLPEAGFFRLRKP